MNRRTSTYAECSNDVLGSATLQDVPKPSIDPEIPDLVSLTEAGKILGVVKQRVHVLVMEGRLAAKQIEGSNAWVCRRSEVERLKPKLGKKSTE